MPLDDQTVEQTDRPWIAANPGFVAPHLPWRICDWTRDYGYFTTVEQARLALDALLEADRPPAKTHDRLSPVEEELVRVRDDLAALRVQHVAAVDALGNRIESLTRLVNARTGHLA